MSPHSILISSTQSREDTQGTPRPVFTLAVTEDPRPGIPQPPRDPKLAVVSPAEFLAAHPDIAGWSGVEHDVYRHLVEVSRVRLTPQYLYAAAEDAETAVSRHLSAADLRVETNIAYLHRDRQIAERARFEQAQYQLAGVAA